METLLQERERRVETAVTMGTPDTVPWVPMVSGFYMLGYGVSFYDFMKEALKDTPDTNFRIPGGIKLVRVNPYTGRPSSPSDKAVIIEALKPDFEFNNRQRTIGEGGGVAPVSSEGGSIQIGGEY